MVQERLIALVLASLKDFPVSKQLFEGMTEADWIVLRERARQQGVGAICFAAFEKTSIRLPRVQMLRWWGHTQSVKTGYENHLIGVKRFATLLNDIDADMLVLKGLALAKYYPDPTTRGFGDLDVFTFDAHDRVNQLVESKGIKIDFWDKHDVFNYADNHVEHHSYFVSNKSKAGRRVNEFILESLAKNKGIKVADNVYYPTPDINAIFILHHTIGHMSYEGATLKNVLDYGLFLMKDGDKVNWDVVRPLMQETGWAIGFNTLTRAAEKVLAEDFSRFYIGTLQEDLADKVLDTILTTTLHQETDLPFFKRITQKWKRLYSHKWMYDRGLIPANFWTDCVWESFKLHLVRPEQL